MTTATAPTASDHGKGHAHGLKLLPFFFALLALTAAEVGLYEWWRHSFTLLPDGTKEFAIPKFALVLLILVFTLPKAYIVLVYFMHIRFEKWVVVVLAVVPLLMTFVCVLPTLTDTAALRDRKQNYVKQIGKYAAPHGHGVKDAKAEGEHK
jgi:glucan phosphoethanolaminetransferase (alkaline phosphatase superfamily)